jgi:hypothetical protein
MLLCGCGYFWLKVCLSGHARLVNFGSLSFLLISHFILPVPRVKLMSHTIDMIFSALRGVNAWPQWYWFWSFYMGFWNYQKWHFMSHAQWRQRALKCYPWNWQLFHQHISLLGFWISQLFKTHTHSCFLCLKTTATSCDKIGTSLVARMVLFGGIWQSWLCTIVID